MVNGDDLPETGITGVETEGDVTVRINGEEVEEGDFEDGGDSGDTGTDQDTGGGGGGGGGGAPPEPDTSQQPEPTQQPNDSTSVQEQQQQTEQAREQATQVEQEASRRIDRLQERLDQLRSGDVQITDTPRTRRIEERIEELEDIRDRATSTVFTTTRSDIRLQDLQSTLEDIDSGQDDIGVDRSVNIPFLEGDLEREFEREASEFIREQPTELSDGISATDIQEAGGAQGLSPEEVRELGDPNVLQEEILQQAGRAQEFTETGGEVTAGEREVLQAGEADITRIQVAQRQRELDENLEAVRTAPEGTRFTFGDEQVTRQEALNVLTEEEQELEQFERQLEDVPTAEQRQEELQTQIDVEREGTVDLAVQSLGSIPASLGARIGGSEETLDQLFTRQAAVSRELERRSLETVEELQRISPIAEEGAEPEAVVVPGISAALSGRDMELPSDEGLRAQLENVLIQEPSEVATNILTGGAAAGAAISRPDLLTQPGGRGQDIFQATQEFGTALLQPEEIGAEISAATIPGIFTVTTAPRTLDTTTQALPESSTVRSLQEEFGTAEELRFAEFAARQEDVGGEATPTISDIVTGDLGVAFRETATRPGFRLDVEGGPDLVIPEREVTIEEVPRTRRQFAREQLEETDLFPLRQDRRGELGQTQLRQTEEVDPTQIDQTTFEPPREEAITRIESAQATDVGTRPLITSPAVTPGLEQDVGQLPGLDTDLGVGQQVEQAAAQDVAAAQALGLEQAALQQEDVRAITESVGLSTAAPAPSARPGTGVGAIPFPDDDDVSGDLFSADDDTDAELEEVFRPSVGGLAIGLEEDATTEELSDQLFTGTEARGIPSDILEDIERI